MIRARNWLPVVALATAVSVTAWAGGSDEQTEAGAASSIPAATTAMAASDGPQVWATLAVYEAETGSRISTISESPMLAARVSAGELPAVEERISEEPMVVQPYAEIGRYGGTLRGKSVRPAGDNDIEIHARPADAARVAGPYRHPAQHRQGMGIQRRQDQPDSVSACRRALERRGTVHHRRRDVLVPGHDPQRPAQPLQAGLDAARRAQSSKRPR